MRYALAAIALVFAVTGPVWADSQTDCLSAALTGYNRQSLALLQSPEPQPLPSVETVIAKRRLQEAYCLLSTRCLYAEAPDIAFRAEFAKCLDDEAKQAN